MLRRPRKPPLGANIDFYKSDSTKCDDYDGKINSDNTDDDDARREKSFKSFEQNNRWIRFFFLLLIGFSLIFLLHQKTISLGSGTIIRAVGHKVTDLITNESSSPQLVTSPTTGATMHLIFSTDCSSFQQWQSYLFFHSALKVQQPGYVTRIVSGCTDTQQKEVQQWHTIHIQKAMSDRFRVHFTPHFSGVKDELSGEVKGDYKFFNKPFGVKHFLEHNELMGVTEETGGIIHSDDIVILCDPDFLLLRPITDDFSNERETLMSPRRQKYMDSMPEKNTTKWVVRHNHPFAQTYGLGTQWRKFNLDDIAGFDSPSKSVEQHEGDLFYPAGPPYISTARDMYRIVVKWSEFVPRVYKQYPHLLAEMYAYCIAAAHLQLNHTLIDSLMVSSPGVGGEGWKFIQAIPSSEICSFASHPDHSRYPVPSVIHYCQRYLVDKYFYGKRKVPHEIFTCDFPLLLEPPMDMGSGKYASLTGASNEKKDNSANMEKMNGFMICALTKATNAAIIHFKESHCMGGGNRGKTYDMFTGRDSVSYPKGNK